jgi:uncharacterized membrane protein YtjA (UPF0391 family)
MKGLKIVRNRYHHRSWHWNKGLIKEEQMLYWAIIFLVIAVIAAIFGFAGIAAAAAGIAKILFFVFLVLFIIALVTHMGRGRTGI